MGRGIAGVCALQGYRVAVYEADAAARSRLREAIEGSWSRAVEKGKVAASAVERARGFLAIVADLSGGADADVVIEAVPESLEAKRRVFAELDRTCARAAVLGSNTSSLSI